MTGALRRAPRAAASVVGLLVVVGAIPALLLGLVGNPLPASIPSWSEAQTALADGWKPTDRFVLGVLAIVLWALWAQLMGHLYAEVRAHRARPRQHAPGVVVAPAAADGRRGLSRRLASWLVGGIMVAGTMGPTAAFAAPAPLPAVLVATHVTSPTPAPPAPPPAADPTAPTAAAPAAAAMPEYVVHTWAESKDCLWNIAERYLGDPIRWHEIEDLNEDVAQPSGRRLGDDPRHWVYAGMVLRLPADATGPGLTTAPAAVTSATATPPPAGPADVAPAPPAVTEPGAGTDAPPAPATSAPPASVAPATTVAPPASVAPATTWPPPPATTPARPAAAAPGSTSVAPPSSVPSPAGQGAGPEGPSPAAPVVQRGSESRSPSPAPFLGVGGLVVAAGVAAEVRRRRRRQLARRRPHERLPELSESAAGAARAVAYAPLEDVDWLSAELRLLVSQLGPAARSRFEATVVQYHGQCAIEIGLARSCGTPPAGWAGTAGSTVWTLEAAHGPEELATVAELPPCLPLLVSLGDQDDHGQVLLNLEASRAVGIVGEPGMVDALARSVLWELAVSPLAERLSLVTLGVEAGDASEMARWRRAVDVDDVASALRSHSASLGAALVAADTQNLAVERARGQESWGPAVAVVAARYATPEVLEAASGPGVVVVVVGDCPADALAVHAAGGEVAIPSIGLVCVAQQLTRDAADSLGCLLAETDADPVPADPAEEPAVAVPGPQADVEDDEAWVAELLEAEPASTKNGADAGAPPPGPVVDAGVPVPNGRPVHVVDDRVHRVEAPTPPFAPRRPRVLVKLLGHPSVDGALTPLTPLQLAGLGWLATHPNPTTSQMKDALWGDVHPKSQRWRDFLSELRDTVSDGVIGAVVDDVIPTSPELGSDLDLLEAFITRAATHPGERVACLQEAVDLLHGMPFAVTGPAAKYWKWLDLEYANGRLWLQLTQATCDLAHLYLAAGDPASAATVADKVLGAAKLDPGLTEVLMLAYGALGVPEAAERVFEAHEAALLDEVGYEGAGDTTRRVIERIRGDRRNGDGHAQPLTLVRSPR